MLSPTIPRQVARARWATRTSPTRNSSRRRLGGRSQKTRDTRAGAEYRRPEDPTCRRPATTRRSRTGRRARSRRAWARRGGTCLKLTRSDAGPYRFPPGRPVLRPTYQCIAIQSLERGLAAVRSSRPRPRPRPLPGRIQGTWRRRTGALEGVASSVRATACAATVHRPQAVVRGRRRAHVPAGLAEDRADRRGGARGDVRRAKLYYLRDRVGKRARVRERRYTGPEERVEAASSPTRTPSSQERRAAPPTRRSTARVRRPRRSSTPAVPRTRRPRSRRRPREAEAPAKEAADVTEIRREPASTRARCRRGRGRGTGRPGRRRQGVSTSTKKK